MNKLSQGSVITGTICVFKKPIPASEILLPEVEIKDEKISVEYLFPFLPAKKKRALQDADILVTGEKFGYGSSREAIVKGIINSGIGAVVSNNLPPDFFRNVINLGLPVFIAPGIANKMKDGDQIEIQYDAQKIIHISSGTSFAIQAIPEFARNIIEMGGVERYMKEMVDSG